MAQSKMPPCPKCGSNKHVVEHGDRNHFCGNAFCKIEFNHDPQDDQEFYMRDPTKRIEKQDERRKAKFGVRKR